MAGCFGCFQTKYHEQVNANAPILRHLHKSSSQVADISHLLGTDGQKPKEGSKLMSYVQAPQHGQYAYEEVGHLGDAQHRTLKLMRHKRSKELVAVKFIRQSAGVCFYEYLRMFLVCDDYPGAHGAIQSGATWQ